MNSCYLFRNSFRKMVCLAGLLFSGLAVAQEEPAAPAESPAATGSFDTRYKQAVALARDDKAHQGLKILEALLIEQPNNYEVRRDYVIILTWAGNCEAALFQYEIVRHRPVLEPYLYPPVSECFEKVRERDKALAQLEEGIKSHPDDKDIKNALKELQTRIKHDARPVYEIAIGSTESAPKNVNEDSNREWFIRTSYSAEINAKTRWYLGYYTTEARDKQSVPGELSRLTAGIRYWMDPKWELDQSFTRELNEEVAGEDLNGSLSSITWYTNSQLQISASYAVNAEDVPLRAKATGIKLNQMTLSADYHTPGYVWEISGSVSESEFENPDLQAGEVNNERSSLYAAAGYGYILKDEIEHRLTLEYSASDNTSTTEDYFNPVEDSGITLVHKTSFVFDSLYDRHVDHLSVFYGGYSQEGFADKTVYGISYEQEYDFSDAVSLGLSVNYASRVYDGNREGQSSIALSLSGRLP